MAELCITGCTSGITMSIQLCLTGFTGLVGVELGEQLTAMHALAYMVALCPRQRIPDMKGSGCDCRTLASSRLSTLSG